MGLLGFQTLRCPKCNHTHVFAAGNLMWQEGKGQSFQPVGYYCIECKALFDTETAIRHIKQKELADKIKELEASSGR